VINKPGLFYYTLVFNAGDSTERLVSAPKTSLLEFASVGGAIDGLWYDTTQTWFDRQADLRDTLAGRSNGGQPGVWLKMTGDWTHRSGFTTSSQFGGFAFNTSYNQDTAGIIGGVDFLNVTDKNQAWVVGIDAGYFNSDMRFAVSPDTFDVQDNVFGGYATYLNGGLFVDGTINANFLRLNSNLPSIGVVPLPVTAKTRGTSIGGQIESGYTMPLGGIGFWEPVGTLSYVNTTMDQIPLPGSSLKLANDDSFRGSLGLRLGVLSDFQFYKIKLAVTGRVWDEFTNDTLSTFIVPGGTNLTNTDNLKGVFGEVSGQANLFSNKSGFSAFANGGYKFKSNYNEGYVVLGARYQF
jgi:autotransporter-like protein